MKMALDKVAFLPFGKLIDQWRWDVFTGKTPPAEYNKAWWELAASTRASRRRSRGARPTSTRAPSSTCPANVPYVRYFLAASISSSSTARSAGRRGTSGPLHKCSIYGSKAAGEKLRAMLAMGASRPWPDALEALSGERQADAGAMLEYFAPLSRWLDEQNKGEACGW